MYKSPYSVSFVQKVTKEAAEAFDGFVMKATVDANITVDRDELVKALAYDRGQYDKGYGDGYQDGERDACEWISVEDGLPGSLKYVLCCGPQGGMFVGRVCDIITADGKVRAFHGGRGRFITHWMPLPEPPKEVESDG